MLSISAPLVRLAVKRPRLLCRDDMCMYEGTVKPREGRTSENTTPTRSKTSWVNWLRPTAHYKAL